MKRQSCLRKEGKGFQGSLRREGKEKTRLFEKKENPLIQRNKESKKRRKSLFLVLNIQPYKMSQKGV